MQQTSNIKPIQSSQSKTPLAREIEINKQVLNSAVGIGISFDTVMREMTFGGKSFALLYLNGFVKDIIMVQVLKELSRLKPEETTVDLVRKLLETYVVHIQVSTKETVEDCIDQVLSGQLVLLVDGETKALVIDARTYPARNPEEPDTERVVRGSRDGFTETLLTNVNLTRRRIRDPRLRMEIVTVGKRSKTDVCVAYIEDVADPGLVTSVKSLLNQIEVDGLPMGEKAVEEFINRKSWNPFPLARYTERPDVASTHLLEGHVLVFVDTSPSVMITPTTYFHHVQHAEEYRQTPVIGGYLRWIRFLGIIASLVFLPLWMMYVMQPDLLPESLSFIGPREAGKIDVFWQFIFAEIGIDLMRMAAVHTPSPLATAMGLIAAVLISEIAMKVGLFIPEVILYLAVAAIGTFATPSYELSLANKLARLSLLLLTYLFKAPGLVVGLTLWIIILAYTRSLNTPYLWPFIPFNFPALVQILFRTPVPYMKRRPSLVHPQDSTRRPQPGG
jgi:stage V sporulation protein AF